MNHKIITLFLITVSAFFSHMAHAECEVAGVGAAIEYDQQCMSDMQQARDLESVGRAKELNAIEAQQNAERAADYWGGVAINLNNGLWYKAHNYGNSRSAQSQLMSACQDSACAVVALYKNTCVAQALGDQGEVFWAEDVKPNIAQQKAKIACNAKANNCETSDQHLACSGYKYTDRNTGEVGTGQKSLSSMWKNFRLGGNLIGLIAPTLVGKSEIAKSEIHFNPVATQLSEQPLSVKKTIDLPEYLDQLKHSDKVPDLYISTALSKNGRVAKTYFGLTPKIAEHEAMSRCNKNDCYVLLTFKNGLCAAQSWGRDSKGLNYDYMTAAKTKHAAEQLALANCEKNAGHECQIAQSFCPAEDTLKNN